MYLLENMTWAQAKEAFAKCKTAIIPWGSIEQHGSLPLGTDFFVAEYMAEDLAKRDYPAIVTPVIPVGFADYHTDFPGTLTLSNETVSAMATEICRKLISYGITHILFYNCHGGNQAPLGRVCYDLRNKGFVGAVFMWYELAGKINFKWAALGHGDVVEAEIVEVHRPGVLNIEGVGRPVQNDLGELKVPRRSVVTFEDIMQVHIGMRSEDFTKSGAMLEPHLYPGADHGQWFEEFDTAKAAPMRTAVNDYVVRFLPEFEKIKFDPICEKF